MESNEPNLKYALFLCHTVAALPSTLLAFQSRILRSPLLKSCPSRTQKSHCLSLIVACMLFLFSLHPEVFSQHLRKPQKKKEKRGLKKKKKSSCITAWRSFLNLIQDFSPFPPAAYLPLWGLPHLKSIPFLVWGRDRKASGWLRVFSSPPICGMTREQPSWRALRTPWLSCATLCVSLQQKPVSSPSTCMLLCRLSLGIK